MATYICSCCGAKYDITERGQYQCQQCGKEFSFDPAHARQQPPPVKKLDPHVQKIIDRRQPVSAPSSQPQKAICPYCKSEIPADALKCAHCGEWITQNGPPKSKGTYLLLAFLFGPLAEFYLGNFIAGIFVFLIYAVIVGSAFSNSFLIASEGMFIAGIFQLIYFIYACCVDVNPAPINKINKKKSSGGMTCIWIFLAIITIVIGALITWNMFFAK